MATTAVSRDVKQDLDFRTTVVQDLALAIEWVKTALGYHEEPIHGDEIGCLALSVNIGPVKLFYTNGAGELQELLGRLERRKAYLCNSRIPGQASAPEMMRMVVYLDPIHVDFPSVREVWRGGMAEVFEREYGRGFEGFQVAVRGGSKTGAIERNIGWLLSHLEMPEWGDTDELPEWYQERAGGVEGEKWTPGGHLESIKRFQGGFERD